MFKILFILLFGLSSTFIRAQSILDLTEQLALDVQKLASIKTTLQDMVQGYDQLKAGYTHIRDIAKGNFDLHKAFLDALLIPSAAVQSDPRLAHILATASRLVTNYRAAMSQVGGNPLFTAKELAYITGTLQTLLEHCTHAMEELTMVTTDNTLRMSDAQRLQALDRIDGEVKADAAFLQQFNNSLAVETAWRQREGNDITTLKKLYGLPD